MDINWDHVEEFREEWRAIGKCTEPADFERAENALREAMGEDIKIKRHQSPKGRGRVKEEGSQFDVYWVAFYVYITEHLGVKTEYKQDLLLMKELVKSVGWWWEKNGTIHLSERPKYILQDDDNRLHSESGKAIEYPDGYGLYYWHGVRVPDWIYEEPEKINWNTIMDQSNMEIRRIMIEMWGRDNFVAQMDIEDQSEWGTLYSKTMEGPNQENVTFKILEVADPAPLTERYFKWVPVECTTALEAEAWTHFSTPEEYAPEMQT